MDPDFNTLREQTSIHQDQIVTEKLEDRMIIKSARILPLLSSKYLIGGTFEFYMNNRQIKWDLVVSKNFVSVLLYNKDSDCFVLVKQFRPAVYVNINKSLKEKFVNIAANDSIIIEDDKLPNPKSAITCEMCSGYLEPDESYENAAIREVFEETGYEIDISRLKKLFNNTLSNESIDYNGQVFYCEVSNYDQKGKGGGLTELEGEDIDVFNLPVSESMNFIENGPYIIPSRCASAILYFLLKKNSFIKKE